MTAIGLKPPPKFVKNEWAWAYTLNKLTEQGKVDGGGNPLHYGAAVAIYKAVDKKYGEKPHYPPVEPVGPALTRAELIACYSDTWLVSRGFAWAANDHFTARLFTQGDEWRIERVADDGTATTSPLDFDTVSWLLRDAPAAYTWAVDQEPASEPEPEQVWVVTETCEYRVKARSREHAEELFLEHGPEISVEGPVQYLGSDARTFEAA